MMKYEELIKLEKKRLEEEIEHIIQSIPEWAKYIPKDDEIRKQMTAIYHAVYWYVSSGKIANEYLQKIYSAVEPHNIFSGKSLGWAGSSEEYSSSDYSNEVVRIRSVEKNILLMIECIKSSKMRKNKHGKNKVEEAYNIYCKASSYQISKRTFCRWIAQQNVPRGFPGIESLTKLAEWASTYDKVERRRKNIILGMDEEEVHQKRKR